MKNLFFFLAGTILASGCVTYPATRYSISADNIVALRSLNGKIINVGAFSATIPGQKEILCPGGAGSVITQDGEPFAEFIRKALLDELKMANVYSPSAPVTITGNLDAINFYTASGYWKLDLTIKSSNGVTFRH